MLSITTYQDSPETVSAKAILHANRSMCHINMKAADLALADANSAIGFDPQYIKGYYRKV